MIENNIEDILEGKGTSFRRNFDLASMLSRGVPRTLI
jgi:hypothetical protein